MIGFRARRAFVLVAVTVTAAVGCKDTTGIAESKQAAGASKPPECVGVDDTDLEATVDCFYRANSGVGLYRFLSAARQAEVTPAEVDAWDWSDVEVLAVAVTKRETIQGASYAAVSLTTRYPQAKVPCTETDTLTWVNEEGHWRVPGGAKTLKEVANRKFNTGDYSGAAESAEQWIKVNPLSIAAYSRLAWAVHRGSPGKNRADTIRAMLGINPADSEALKTAIAVVDDAEVAESYLDRLRKDDCYLNASVFNVALAKKPKAALELLDKYSVLKDADLVLPRIDALRTLGRAKEVPALLDAATATRVRELLDAADPMFAADWSASLAEALLAAGDKPAARAWVDFGLLKDPSDKRLARLLRATKPAP